MKRTLLALLLAPALLLAAACSGGGADREHLEIWWFQWDPAQGLQELGDEFERETGVPVKVHAIPISSYQEQVFLDFGNKQTSFDIVIGDSQWIGRGATDGLYLELTDWLPTVVDMETIHPRAARYLCEYPPGSGRWYAAPAETDAVGICYRKDWFTDPAEQEAYRARFGRELRPPETWDEFQDVAEFFHRPDEKRYGCAVLTGRQYDALTMGFQHALWAYGADWGDRETYQVDGVLNTPAAADAIEFYKELIALGPRDASNLDYGKALEAFQNGSVAMCMNYFAFFPGLQRDMGDQVGFALIPEKDGRRVVSLGGQGLSISTKIPPERQELAKQFIAWFLQRETQEEWITKPAGFTSHVEILSSQEFRDATPYNAPFADSIDSMRDFWNVPEFNELMAAAQRYVGQAIDGELSPEEALDRLAAEHERILRDAGLLRS